MNDKQMRYLCLGGYSYLAVMSASKGNWLEAIALFATALIFLPVFEVRQEIRIGVSAGITVYLFGTAMLP